MRGTDIVRSQHAPFRIEPRFGKVAKDSAEHASSVSIEACEETGYVLEEPEGSFTFSQYAKGVRPEVSIVEAAFPLPGLRVRLARKAAGDDVAAAPPCFRVEGADVGVDGERFTAWASTSPAPFPFRQASRNLCRLASYSSLSCLRFATIASGVGHVTASGAEDSLAVGVSLHSADCVPSEDEAAKESSPDSGEE